MTDALADARDAHSRRDWPRSHALFTAAAGSAELGADDLYSLSDAAWWLGRIEESLAAGESAYREYLRSGNTRRAAMAAIELAGLEFMRGHEVRGSAWLGTANRLADDPDGIERAYLTYFTEVEAGLDAPDPAPAIDAARRVRDVARRHTDPDLVALSTMGEGRALIRLGRVAEGIALLDEAMAAALSDELDPGWAGNIYCNMIATCHELADLRRMWAWTQALERWCATMPAAVMFTGICRVHRAQLPQWRGDWSRSEADAARVCTDLKDLSVANTAEAYVVVGDARRLRGELAGAERAYLKAHELGRDPQPGMALLRLAQGRPQVALKSVQAALAAEVRGPPARAGLCVAAVDIALAAGALDVARKAADELDEAADHFASPGLSAMAAHARGAVLLGEAHPADALGVLRDACRRWRELDVPFDCARVRLLLAEAYAALGDLDASARERAAADATFARLRGVADGSSTRALPDGLTAREVEVLALVAAGNTNRQVAAELVLSEKTVARHLSNIFAKLGLSSRTAAAAYAFDHGLAAPADG